MTIVVFAAATATAALVHRGETRSRRDLAVGAPVLVHVAIVRDRFLIVRAVGTPDLMAATVVAVVVVRFESRRRVHQLRIEIALQVLVVIRVGGRQSRLRASQSDSLQGAGHQTDGRCPPTTRRAVAGAGDAVTHRASFFLSVGKSAWDGGGGGSSSSRTDSYRFSI